MIVKILIGRSCFCGTSIISSFVALVPFTPNSHNFCGFNDTQLNNIISKATQEIINCESAVIWEEQERKHGMFE